MKKLKEGRMKQKTKSISVAEYKEQAKPQGKRQLEKKLQMDFGKILFGFENYKRFSPNLIKYSYIANGERRPGEVKQVMGKRGKLIKKHISRVGSELKIKGVRKGIFDYFFCIKRNGIAYDIWLEAKAPNGVMTKEQKEFKEKAYGVSNIRIHEFRSVYEAVRILENEGIVLIN